MTYAIRVIGFLELSLFDNPILYCVCVNAKKIEHILDILILIDRSDVSCGMSVSLKICPILREFFFF